MMVINTMTVEPYITSKQQEYEYRKRDTTLLIASTLVVSTPERWGTSYFTLRINLSNEVRDSLFNVLNHSYTLPSVLLPS